MFRALHDLHRSSQSQNANLESKREFAPYFKRSAEMGGSKRAVTHRYGAKTKPLHQRFTKEGAVCGGAQAPFAGVSIRDNPAIIFRSDRKI
jgi:hypothetical protein